MGQTGVRSVEFMRLQLKDLGTALQPVANAFSIYTDVQKRPDLFTGLRMEFIMPVMCSKRRHNNYPGNFRKLKCTEIVQILRWNWGLRIVSLLFPVTWKTIFHLSKLMHWWGSTKVYRLLSIIMFVHIRRKADHSFCCHSHVSIRYIAELFLVMLFRVLAGRVKNREAGASASWETCSLLYF